MAALWCVAVTISGWQVPWDPSGADLPEPAGGGAHRGDDADGLRVGGVRGLDLDEGVGGRVGAPVADVRDGQHRGEVDGRGRGTRATDVTPSPFSREKKVTAPPKYDQVSA